jgi:hypothetical protein
MIRLRVSGLQLPLRKSSEEDLRQALVRALGVRTDHLRAVTVAKKSLDARKGRRAPAWVIAADVVLAERPARTAKGVQVGEVPVVPSLRKASGRDLEGLRAEVVGTGPAGLFAALALSERGASVRVLEQGPPLRERVAAVKDLWRLGRLSPEASVQFGEGGAGTFSDGKLRTRVKDPLARAVLSAFVECGAPPGILEDAHPHLGTDGVRAVVKKMRERLEGASVRFCFGETLHHVERAGAGYELVSSSGRRSADAAFLAVGHSSRALFRSLTASGVPFRAKGFAVGVRAEHPQSWVDERQYGRYAGHPELPAAEYFLTFRDGPSGRGVYSFCMCPGGLVVNSSSEPGLLVTNGMSLSNRASGFANAGIVVAVAPGDFGGEPLRGIEFQESLERRGYEAGGGGYAAPAQSLRAFLEGTLDPVPPRTTFRPSVRVANLRGLFPGWVEEPLARALQHFGRILPGFVEEGVLLAPETRTSSPFQVERSEDLSVRGFPGLYLVGEGAGWAGGIVSSAVDALRCVEAFGRPPK